MSTFHKHIKAVREAVEHWLSDEHAGLQAATQKTVETGLFSREDIDHALSAIQENIRNNELEEWAQRVSLSDSHLATGTKVLCLHAGNLPLVGFQTALGTILSGADYYGKLSRKDPYLLRSFLDEIKRKVSDQAIQLSTDLQDFKDLQADKVVFAGSEDSVPAVKEEIQKLKAANAQADYIIRTAKFSIAYLEHWNEETKRALIEGMLRYGGKGCRSVGVVVAPFGLDEVRAELEEEMPLFWKENPQYGNPPPALTYQYAYNQGIQREQLWLDKFLVQESSELPDTDLTVNWVQGDTNTLRDLHLHYGSKVQSVYTTGESIKGLRTESLDQAQRPPLYWKPDGVDVIDSIFG